MAQVLVQGDLRPCTRLLLPLLLAATAVSAVASPVERDLYALSKLKSSLLSRSARNSTSLADWDTIKSSSGHVSSSHYHCNFSGITCDATNGHRVVAINLTGVPLPGGVLPAQISLTVAGCSLSGPMPASLSSMPLLRRLNLSVNNLAGPFPPPPPDAAAAPYFPSLEVLDEYNNNFLGPLPPLGGSRLLRHLHLGGNYFTGSIPEAYGDMEGLVYLGLQANSLSGHVPPSLSRLRRLREMYLGYYNSFDGGIPPEFGELGALVLLDMSSCGLTGPIPPQLGGLTQLETLYLQWNKLSGGIPAQLGDLKSLVNLDISNNKLTGQIPATITGLSRLKQLILFDNDLHGVIPESLGKLSELEDLQIGSNNLSGVLPANLGNNSRLLYLDVSGNQLTGAIPPHLVCVNNNMLNGSIPWSLFDLPGNYWLDLSNNLLSGELPRVIPRVGLSLLSVASNNLSGPVPPEIGYLKNLSLLNVSANALTGGIPPELSHCESLTVLDLNQNRLSGEIPDEIKNLKVLKTLNVSYDNLSGCMPQSQLQGVFAVSDEAHFQGNPSLCVEHVTAASCSLLQCSARRVAKTSMLPWLVPTVFYLMVAMTMCLALMWREAAKRRPPAWKMTLFHKLELEMDDVLGSLREENAVGRGGAGTVYRFLTRGGAAIAVKRLPGPGRRDHGFRAEVTTLGGVQHRNIVRLLGFASSTEGNLLLYEYMAAGSLGAAVHDGERGALLGWGAQHRVATEAARALCYLHHECSPRILHRDVKSSNILLDAAMEAHVADFGLARFLRRGASGSVAGAVAAEECVSAVAGT
nr:unnamed protein product [Digitaria exilis]